MMPKAVGMFGGEIFITELKKGIDDKIIFDVIRPVSVKVMEALRTVGGAMEYGWDEMWRQAVASGATELGMDDWIENCLMDEDLYNDPEAFLGKDDSFTQYLTDDERKIADDWLKENEDFEVGTWEASGTYDPNFRCDFEKFDVVFDKELANIYYKELEAEGTVEG